MGNLRDFTYIDDVLIILRNFYILKLKIIMRYLIFAQTNL